MNSHLETFEGLKVLLDLWDWEFDEHTGDLWSLVLTGDHLDVVEDEVTNLLLHEWVFILDGWQELLGLLLVLLLGGQLLFWLSWHHWLSLHHTWLLWHTLGLWHSWLLHHSLVHGLRHVSSLVVTWLLEVSSLALVATVLHVSSSVSILLLSHVTLWLLLDELEQLLDDVSQVWLTGQVVPLETATGNGDVLLPISLVSDLFELKISDFLDLVVVDDQSFAFIGLSMEGLLGVGAGIWLLEADESKSVVSESLIESDLFNLSVWLEEVGKLNFGPGGWEVLDIQVASLLGVLVSDGFHKLLLLSLLLVQEVSDVHLLAVAHIFILEGLDSLLN